MLDGRTDGAVPGAFALIASKQSTRTWTIGIGSQIGTVTVQDWDRYEYLYS